MLGEGCETEPEGGLMLVQDADEGADVRPVLLFVCVRERSGEKWMELNAGERSVGVGVAEVIIPDPPWVEICEGEFVNDCTPAGSVGRFLMLPDSSIAP